MRRNSKININKFNEEYLEKKKIMRNMQKIKPLGKINKGDHIVVLPDINNYLNSFQK